MIKGIYNNFLYPCIPTICECKGRNGCTEIIWDKFRRGIRYRKGHMTETKWKLSEKRRGIPSGMLGKHQTEYQKQIASLTHKNRIASKETKQKLSKINSEKCNLIPWEKLSDKQKEKIKHLGKENGNWQGGSSFLPYCSKFNNILKEKVRCRDNYTCQNPRCKLTQQESILLYNQSLHVHHIHYDKQNCYPDLITLCLRCNVNSNFNRTFHEQLYMNILNNRELLFWTNNLNIN